MKIALVHDWLHGTYGGAERVLIRFSKLFPEADIYTLLFEEERFKTHIDPKRVHTSFLQSFPAKMKESRKYLLPFIRPAVEEWNFDEYDIVLSSSSAFVKNIKTTHTHHICYCHTPARFLWDYETTYLEELELSRPMKYLVQKMQNRLKYWDEKTNEVDTFVANSKTIADRIEQYYNRSSTVIYPPVSTESIDPVENKSDYFITLSTLTAYKKIDLVVRAFNQTKRKLVVVGEGPERTHLEKIANDNIVFAGFVSEKKKIQLLQKARGLIFPNEEDFGIAPVEALAAGTPVIGYARGGVTETVTNNTTGILFEKQNESELLKAVKKAEGQHFSAKKLSNSAEKYAADVFDNKIRLLVENVTKK